jgi:hypothetical protein
VSTAQGVTALIGATVPSLVALASLLWWTYKRGEAAGEDRAKRRADERAQVEGKAKIEALERLLTETRTELASLQPRRRRALEWPRATTSTSAVRPAVRRRPAGEDLTRQIAVVHLQCH